MKKNDFFIAPRGTKQTFTCEQAPDGTLCLLGDKQFIKNGVAIIAFPVEKRRTYSTDSEDIILYEVLAGDYLAVYENSDARTILRSYYIDEVKPSGIETRLADTLIVQK